MFLPLTDREPLISTCECALQVGQCLVFLHALSAVYSEWQKDICVWSLAPLNTTLERSSYPPQANDPPSTIHGKKATAPVKYTSMLFSTLTPQSDGLLLLVSRSPACLEGTGVHSQSPSNTPSLR